MLAGDALQALAFEILADVASALPVAARLQQVQVLAHGIGTAGMAGGQAIDLEAVGRELDAVRIEAMHRRKTGALIQASVLLGAIGAGITAGAEYEALRRYGAELGLAFQIHDDVLDVAGETAALGKTAGADAARGKPTYPSLSAWTRRRAWPPPPRCRGRGTAGAGVARHGSRRAGGFRRQPRPLTSRPGWPCKLHA